MMKNAQGTNFNEKLIFSMFYIQMWKGQRWDITPQKKCVRERGGRDFTD